MDNFKNSCQFNLKKNCSRIEGLEVRTQENFQQIEVLFNKMPPPVDYLTSEIEALNVSIQSTRMSTLKAFTDLKEHVSKMEQKKPTEELELRLTERINEILRVLTRKMAEKEATRKQFRVLEHRLNKLMELVEELPQLKNALAKDALLQARHMTSNYCASCMSEVCSNLREKFQQWQCLPQNSKKSLSPPRDCSRFAQGQGCSNIYFTNDVTSKRSIDQEQQTVLENSKTKNQRIHHQNTHSQNFDPASLTHYEFQFSPTSNDNFPGSRPKTTKHSRGRSNHIYQSSNLNPQNT